MKLIETKTLGTAAASIEFTSIPQTFTDLVILFSFRNSTDSYGGSARFNGDTSTSNYSSRRLFGNGTAPASDSNTSLGRFTFFGGVSSLATANTFGNGSLYIPNYTSATAKSMSADTVSENNATLSYQVIDAGLWNQTAAITAVSIFPAAGSTDMVAGSTFSLYGITKGSDGIVTTS
jgi:hypothetical protein